MSQQVTLAYGTLPASDAPILSAAIYTANYPGQSFSGGMVQVRLANTNGSDTETIVLTIQPNGGTAYRLARIVLAPNQQAELNVFIGATDILTGSTTDASIVDYLIQPSVQGPSLAVYDANGALLNNTSGTSGNNTVAGIAAALQFQTTPPFTSDVFASTMTIDTTKGLHIIPVANGTSATCTMTPSAIPAAGVEMTIIQACTSAGTVTTTYGAGFKSTGTQATTASHWSSITFVSDGTQLIEKCRATASA